MYSRLITTYFCIGIL